MRRPSLAERNVARHPNDRSAFVTFRRVPVHWWLLDRWLAHGHPHWDWWERLWRRVLPYWGDPLCAAYTAVWSPFYASHGEDGADAALDGAEGPTPARKAGTSGPPSSAEATGTLMDEHDLNGIREQLVWALRWLAADPEAAISAVDGIVTADEIALDVDDWFEVAQSWQILEPAVVAVVQRIDETFESISGPDHPELWTDDAIRSSPLWEEQRQRARQALALMGESRADADLSPGIYVIQGRRGTSRSRF